MGHYLPFKTRPFRYARLLATAPLYAVLAASELARVRQALAPTALAVQLLNDRALALVLPPAQGPALVGANLLVWSPAEPSPVDVAVFLALVRSLRAPALLALGGTRLPWSQLPNDRVQTLAQLSQDRSRTLALALARRPLTFLLALRRIFNPLSSTLACPLSANWPSFLAAILGPRPGPRLWLAPPTARGSASRSL